VLHAAGGRTAAAQAEQEQSEAIMTKQLYGTRRPLRSKAPVLPVWQQQDI
jgi:hypothetical protein